MIKNAPTIKTACSKRLLLFLISCLLSFALTIAVNAQLSSFRFEKFGVDQGLSNQIVTQVLRDSEGFLWVGTDNGLNCFDGYGFKQFLADEKNPNGLRDGAITTLFEDSRGNLWIGTKTGGLHLFNRRTETFRAFQRGGSGQNGLSDNRIYRVYEDKDGSIWVGTANGLDKIIRHDTSETIQIISFKNDPNNPESLSNNRVQAITRDSLGNLWLGTKEGLNRMVSENPARFERFLNDKNHPTSIPDNEVYSLLSDREGNLWVGLWGGGGLTKINASELSKSEPVFNRFPYDEKSQTGLRDDIVVNLIEDGAGNLWFCHGDDGSLSFLPRNQRDLPNPRFLTLENDASDSASLAKGSVTSIVEDSQGLIWVATMEGGLNKLDRSKSVFHIFRNYPGKTNSLPVSLVTDVVEDTDGSLWVSSDFGLTHIESGKEPFAEPAFTNYKASEPPAEGGLRTNSLDSLLVDSKGRLWIGTIRGGLQLREKRDDKIYFKAFYKDPNNPKSIGNDAILAMIEDSRGTIWIGTYQGLYKLVEAENGEITFEGFRSKKDDPATLSHDTIESLAEGADGNIWVGTMQGLNRLEPASGKVTRFLAKDNPESLNNDFISSLLNSAQGALWIGTKAGLAKFDFATQKFARADSETGLSKLSIQNLAEDSDGKIWAGTINGLFRLDSEKNTTVHFGKNDGLPGEIFSRGAACKGKNGTLYFGTSEGLVAFNPREIEPNSFAPPIVLTDLLLANRAQPIKEDSILPAHLQYLDKIVLNYTDNIFTVEFSGLNFRQPENNRYAYKLEGLYNDWIETDGKNRRATFTNLNPGEYIFRVKAANNDGVWNAQDKSIKIVVLPPWWKTWWAQTAFYLLIALGLLAIPYVRLSMLEKQRAALENQVAERTVELRETNHQLLEASRAKSVFLSNMSHELRTPLNAVIGFAQLMGRDAKLNSEQRGNLGIIQRAGEHLLGLINDVLSLSKIEAGKLVLNETVFDLRETLRTVEEMLRVRAESKNLSLLFEIEKDVPRLVEGDESKLRQVLVNLLGNAVKFTEEGGIVLRCAWKDGRARFEIEDTGVGIAEDEIGNLFVAFAQTESGRAAKEGTGLGLVISRQIVELMGGDIAVKSKPNAGTVFSFEINLPPTEESEKLLVRRKIVGLADAKQAPRILVVDDTFENRILLSKLLAAIGFEVREARDGEEAFEIWKGWRPDLIFMDLRMPVCDGYEATRRIRIFEKAEGANFSHRKNPTKIVALTASAFENERGEIIKDGADDFLAKPFREETVFDNISKHLGVAYLYEDETSASEKQVPDAEILIPARFARVSPAVLSEFEHALRLGDDVAALQATDKLREIDPALAAAIARAVKNYDFDLVLRAMGKG